MKSITLVLIAIALLFSCKNEIKSASNDLSNKVDKKIETAENTMKNISEDVLDQEIEKKVEKTINTSNNQSDIEKKELNKDKVSTKEKVKEEETKVVYDTKSQTQKVITAASDDTNIKVNTSPTDTPKSSDEKPVLPPNIQKDKSVDPKTTPQIEAKPSLHDDFDKFLTSYVSSNGKVNYNQIKANSQELDKVIKHLQENPILESWSKNKKLAYWINAYNAFTIKKIVDNYPIKSITDLDSGKPWDVKWINLGGKTYSLNNIENDIIRPQFKDARIHFAVNCAAKSCPPLLNKAYTEANLNDLLNSQTKKFINNTRYNKLDGSTLSISKIFDWYKEDFGNVVTYLNKYASSKIDADAKVEYMEYNWSLNN